MEDATMVTIRRAGSTGFQLGRRVKVYIDGNVVGQLDYGESVDVEIESGYHRIVIKDWVTGWTKSKTIDFNIETGETAYFETGSVFKNARVWVGVLLLASLFDKFAPMYLPSGAVAAIFLTGVLVPTIWIFMPGNLYYLIELEDPESEAGLRGQDDVKRGQRGGRSTLDSLPFAGRRYG